MNARSVIVLQKESLNKEATLDVCNIRLQQFRPVSALQVVDVFAKPIFTVEA